MFRIIPIIFALFCSNIALSGDFSIAFQNLVSQNEKAASTFEERMPGKGMGKTLFVGLLKTMNTWLEGMKINGYQMDNEDIALLEKVTNLTQ